MEFKHTPGPWHYQNELDGIEIRAEERNGETNYVARLYGGSMSEAYARLIAAAPDLLAALDVLTDHAEETYPHFESERGQRDIAAARAAIKDARGES